MSSIIGEWEAKLLGYTFKFEFKKNGRFVSNAYASLESVWGTYTIKGDRIYLHAKEGVAHNKRNIRKKVSGTATYNYIRAGDNLKLIRESEEGDLLSKSHFELTKAPGAKGTVGCLIIIVIIAIIAFALTR